MATKRSKIWSAIRYIRRFSLEDLQVTTESTYDDCQRYVQQLLSAGYLRLVSKEVAPGQRFTYVLIRNSGPLTPSADREKVYDPNLKRTFVCAVSKTKPGRDDAWKAMREMDRFTCRGLSQRSRASTTNLHRFIRALLTAGYLEVLSPATPGPYAQSAVYKLVRNTGELAPVVQRDGSLKDPNLEELGDIDGQTTD